MDYKSLTDDDLNPVCTGAIREQERRASLAQIPTTIQELADKYAEGGGDREDILKVANEHE